MIQTRTDKQEVVDLLDRYVTFLDERRFDEWLDLFTDDCYYTLILHEDYVKNTNMLAIGEDKIRLAGRIEVGKGVERGLTMHLLTAITLVEKDGVLQASSNFATIRAGVVHCWGRYQMSLARSSEGLRIERCTAILYNDSISGTIYLPV